MPTGFVDPIASTGFRERREFTSGAGVILDGYDSIDLQWEMKRE